MSGRKKPWHSGGYQRYAALVRAHAYRNPSTVCMTCKRTLAEIRREHPNAKWTAGHVNDSETNGLLGAECSRCNYSRGATYGNQRRRPMRVNRSSRQW